MCVCLFQVVFPSDFFFISLWMWLLDSAYMSRYLSACVSVYVHLCLILDLCLAMLLSMTFFRIYCPWFIFFAFVFAIIFQFLFSVCLSVLLFVSLSVFFSFSLNSIDLSFTFSSSPSLSSLCLRFCRLCYSLSMPFTFCSVFVFVYVCILRNSRGYLKLLILTCLVLCFLSLLSIASNSSLILDCFGS